jgi:hypothetical protein
MTPGSASSQIYNEPGMGLRIAKRPSQIMATTLPPELLTHIFSFAVSDDNAGDLHSFSYVASLWSAPAQRLLFQRIIVRTYELWGRLLRRLPMSPHLRAFIHSLEICIPVTIHPSASRLLRRMIPNLEELIFSTRSPSFDLLSHFSGVKRLQFYGYSSLSLEVLAETAYCTNVVLEELRIHNPLAQAELLDWIDATRTREEQSLKILTLSVFGQGGSQRIRKFLEDNNALEHLVVDLNVQDEGLPIHQGSLLMHINSNSKLTRFILDISLGHSQISCLTINSPLELGPYVYPALFNLLHSTQLLYLENLKLNFGIGQYTPADDTPPNATLDPLDWAIPVALTKRLKKVVIKCEREPDNSIEEFVRLFGDANARGVIAIEGRRSYTNS